MAPHRNLGDALVWREMVDSLPDAILLVDAGGSILYANPFASSLFGYQQDELRGKSIEILIPERVRGQHKKHVDGYTASPTMRPMGSGRDLEAVTKGGTKMYVEIALSPISAGGVAITSVVVRDITEHTLAKKRLENRHANLEDSNRALRREAHYDTLTGLPNRALFHDRLTSALERARRDDLTLALLFLDLDYFKDVNDTLGHAAGDELLKQAAYRIADVVRRTDTVARIGGDEFTVILEKVDAPTSVDPICDKLIKSLQDPFAIEGQDCYISASVGVALAPRDARDLDVLLSCADLALYAAKSAGRGTHRYFESELNEASKVRLSLTNRLRHAFANDAFAVHYYPQFDLQRHALTGMEALLRWNDGDSVRPASHFVGALRETDLVIEVDRWVLRQACLQRRLWGNLAPNMPWISINLAPRTLRHPGWVQEVERVLRDTELDATLLRFDIAEHCLTAKYLSNVHSLEKMGCTFAVDDFGAELGSIRDLHAAKASTVKIADSVLAGLCSKNSSLAVATVELAKTLGRRVVGKGVENQDHVNALLRHGCTQGQGSFLGAPMAGSEARVWFAEDLS